MAATDSAPWSTLCRRVAAVVLLLIVFLVVVLFLAAVLVVLVFGGVLIPALLARLVHADLDAVLQLVETVGDQLIIRLHARHRNRVAVSSDNLHFLRFDGAVRL